MVPAHAENIEGEMLRATRKTRTLANTLATDPARQALAGDP
jgi:hypothetical protein